MRHSSVKLDTPCEFVNVTQINPLISKCQIKVCYVSDEPNRNHTVINKETAYQLANSLPGSPIVGFYDPETKDFEEHSVELEENDGHFTLKDVTKPYGFVDINAKVWFQKFRDDGAVDREYLMTEGYLWTGQYPEAQRIIDKGDNQSMELTNINGEWANSDNEKYKFFIINEAVISKLCILGENFEPCFEGANITNVQFSYEDDFKNQLFSMMKEIKDLLKEEKGGTQMFTTFGVNIGDSLWNSLYSFAGEAYTIAGVYEDDAQKYAVLQNKEDNKFYRLNFSFGEDESFVADENMAEIEYSVEPQFSAEDIAAYAASLNPVVEEPVEVVEEEKVEDKIDETVIVESEVTVESDNSVVAEESVPEEEKVEEVAVEAPKYVLEEIPEYMELKAQYAALEQELANLKAEKADVEAQLEPLKEFKLAADRAEKKKLIDSFYMLSDEDKKDVMANIDTYSLKEIKSELAVKCFDNHIDFSFSKQPEEAHIVDVSNVGSQSESLPAWVANTLAIQKEN